MAGFESDDNILARVAERVSVAPEEKTAERKRPVAKAKPAGKRLVWTLPGVLGPTHVSTTFGEVPAHLVRPRDRLRTREGGFLPVLRIDEYKIDEDFLVHQPDAKPVVVKAGSFGSGVPSRDAYFSPGQAILKLSSGVRHELVAAKDVSAHLYALDRSVGVLSYHVFHLSRPALIRCEGIWVRMGA